MISQREARRLVKQCRARGEIIRKQRAYWSHEYPGGVYIASVVVGSDTAACIRTARRLDHAVVVVERGQELLFYALPHPAEEP